MSTHRHPRSLHLLRLVAALAVLLAASLPAPAAPLNLPVAPLPEVLAAPTADAAWALTEKTFHPAKPAEGLLPPALAAYGLEMFLRRAAAVEAFASKYPDDPRRWLGLQQLARHADYLLHMTDNAPPERVAAVNAVFPEAGRKAFAERVAALRGEAMASADLPAEVRAYYEFSGPEGWMAMQHKLRQAHPQGHLKFAELEPLRVEMNRMAAAYPESKIGSYLMFLDQLLHASDASPAQVSELWTSWAQSPNASVRDFAGAMLERIRLVGQTPALAFTAADGRPVDLKSLQGKIVLVDFWATWCTPCLKALPSVKKTYATYHDQGFEIVGISLENAQLKPNDTPETAAAKLEKAKQALLAFTAKEQMPWPQYCDGKYWKTELALKFKVQSVPRMILIGRDGRVVDAETSAEKLEVEVGRLLKS